MRMPPIGRMGNAYTQLAFFVNIFETLLCLAAIKTCLFCITASIQGKNS